MCKKKGNKKQTAVKMWPNKKRESNDNLDVSGEIAITIEMCKEKNMKI